MQVKTDANIEAVEAVHKDIEAEVATPQVQHDEGGAIAMADAVTAMI